MKARDRWIGGEGILLAEVAIGHMEADLELARAIVDSAGIIVTSGDMTTRYDERGAKYDLPKYVLSDATNLIKD